MGEVDQQFLGTLHRERRDDQRAARSHRLCNFALEKLPPILFAGIPAIPVAIGAVADDVVERGRRSGVGMK